MERWRSFALVAIISVVVACGGGGGDTAADDPQSETTATTAAVTTAPAETTTTEATTTTTEATTTTAAASGCETVPLPEEAEVTEVFEMDLDADGMDDSLSVFVVDSFPQPHYGLFGEYATGPRVKAAPRRSCTHRASSIVGGSSARVKTSNPYDVTSPPKT